jgi:glycosyltransferase involved in cell wall biosynthesis
VKLAVVVQRYGQAINGGAELHARYIAEHLARHAQVEVLTTCASDYVTWRNELPDGVDRVNGVAVRRFPVRHERDPLAFGKRSEHVFNEQHSVADELDWLDAEGPTSTALVDYIGKHASEFDFLIFFSYRYYHSYFGVRASGSRAVLVPTAERDSAIGLSIFKPIFKGVRGLMYNSPEERAMIQALANNKDVPGVVVGIGSEVPQNQQPNRFRQKFNIRGPFALYVGRIDENKGCKELFDFFQTYIREAPGRLTLVLIGNSLLPVPEHPRIRHLGFLSDADKFDALAGSDLLVMPSYFESLSMVALEAWALGKPVLANAKCDVLKGQCIRSNGGLYYEGADEFIATLNSLERNRWLSASLGKNGRQFYHEHYDWPVIERKYLDMFDRLSKEAAPRALDPMPGWMDRRRQECAPGAEIVAALPAGPVVHTERSPAVARPQTPPPPAPTGRKDFRGSGRHQQRPSHQPRPGRPARTGGR